MGLDLKFDKLGKNNPDKTGEENAEDAKNEDIELYNAPSNVRNICFHLKDGKQILLNYAYLISCEYDPNGDCISMIFTSHLITLEGEMLEPLFKELTLQTPKIIKSSNERYASIKALKTFFIRNIILKSSS